MNGSAYGAFPNGTNGTNTTLASAADNQVSWQSALWGLIALSLGAMTQRSGADRFPSSDALSPVRTSPFICGADIIVASIWLFNGKRIGLGFGSALHWSRQEMGLIRGSADRELVQGIPVVTISLFVLGPLPQAIKMFGMTGLPWTKLWAVILFVAWVIEVILRFCAGISSEKEGASLVRRKMMAKTTLRRVSKMTYQVAFMAQIAVWLWILIATCATPNVRWAFGAGFVISLWGFAIGIGVWIGTLYLITIVLRTYMPAGGAPIVTAYFSCLIGLTVGWYKIFFSQQSFDLLSWLFKISGPFGFILALFVLVFGLYVFIRGCTLFILTLDLIIMSLGEGNFAETHEEESSPLQQPHQTEEPDVEIGSAGVQETSGEENAEAAFPATRLANPPARSTTLPIIRDNSTPSPGVGRSNTTPHVRPPTIGPSILQDTATVSTRNDSVHATTPPVRDWSQSLEALSDGLANLSMAFHWPNQTPDQNRRILAMAFAMTNLWTTLLYYMLLYSPEGTVKPSWTEMLG